jgi:hypothetical protein
MRDRHARNQKLVRGHDFWGSLDDDDGGYERDKDELLDEAIYRMEHAKDYNDAWEEWT